MAFEVLTHHCDSELANLFLWMSEEESFRATTLLTYGIKDYADDGFSAKEFAKAYEEHLKKHTPALVISFLPSSLIQHKDQYCRQAEITAKLCKRFEIPLLQLSSWQAGADDCDVEVHKVLKKIEAYTDHKSRQMLLRTDWLVDASNSSLFSEFLPMFVGASAEESLDFKDNIFGSPVTLSYVCHSIIAITYQVIYGAENWRTYSIAGSDYCSEADIASTLARIVAGLYESEPPVIYSSDNAISLMGCSSHNEDRALTDDFGVQKISWRRGLKRAVAKWLKVDVVRTIPLKTDEKGFSP